MPLGPLDFKQGETKRFTLTVADDTDAIIDLTGCTAISTISPTAAGQTFGFYRANPPTGSDGTANSTLSASSLYSASSILIPPAASPTVVPTRRRVTSETLLAA